MYVYIVHNYLQVNTCISIEKFSIRALVHLAGMKYWEQLSLEYMTEELDDSSDPTVIIEHCGLNISE